MEDLRNQHVKHTQKDYTLSFKLSVVYEKEHGKASVIGVKKKYGIHGRATVINWLRKYGTFYWDNHPQ